MNRREGYTMNRRDRKAAVAKAKAEGMNRRDRKALGRSLKTQSMEEKAKDNAREALLRSDDWQAVGQRRRDLIEGLKRFNESEAAARGEKGPGGSIYRSKEYALDELLRRRRGRGSVASSILSPR